MPNCDSGCEGGTDTIAQKKRKLTFDSEGNTRADILVDEEGKSKGISTDASTVGPLTVKIGRKPSSKEQLYRMCSALRLTRPIFECCKEEGMSHLKMFTFKVVVKIQRDIGTGTMLECFGSPRRTKKAAAEDAADGAVWYFNQRENAYTDMLRYNAAE